MLKIWMVQGKFGSNAQIGFIVHPHRMGLKDRHYELI